MLTNRTQLWKELETLLRRCTSYKGEITEDSRLTGDLQLDSMALLSLTVEIENHYKIVLGNGQEVPETLGQVLSMIEMALKKKGQQMEIKT